MMVSSLSFIIVASICINGISSQVNLAPIICGSGPISGSFSNQPIKFEVKMPFYGDMFFSFNYNGFTLSKIYAYNKLNPTRLLAQTPAAGINYLLVSTLAPNSDIIFEVDGIGTGRYNGFTHCESKPVPPPTNTPAPTHAGTIQCDSPITGDFNGEPIIFDIFLPYSAELSFYITGIPQLSAIKAYNTLNPGLVLQQTSNPYMTLIAGANDGIRFIVSGTGKSLFNAMAKCLSSSNPSNVPPPQNPSIISCGASGEWFVFENQQISVGLTPTHSGPLTFELGGAFGVTITQISVYDKNDLTNQIQRTSSSNPTQLYIPYVVANINLLFKISGYGSGSFYISTTCASASQPVATIAPPLTPPVAPQPPQVPQIPVAPLPPQIPQVPVAPLPPQPPLPPQIPGIPVAPLPPQMPANPVIPGVPIAPLPPQMPQVPQVTPPLALPQSGGTIPMCPGNQVLNPSSYVCECPATAPNGLYYPQCQPPFVRDELYCDCSLPPPTPSPTIRIAGGVSGTPRPTQYGHLMCGGNAISGMLSDPNQQYFDVRIPHDGDLRLTVSVSSGSTLRALTAYDQRHPAHPVIMRVTGNMLYIPELTKNADIGFRVEGIGNGLYIARTECTTDAPTRNPTTAFPTRSPTPAPSNNPTKAPSNNPTSTPTKAPTRTPTPAPSNNPTMTPTNRPTGSPTPRPTNFPTETPTNRPSMDPTISPTNYPSVTPTKAPSNNPTVSPTNRPSISPTKAPTNYPSLSPTPAPTHPGMVTCGLPLTGDFNGQELVFGLGVPYAADLTFTIEFEEGVTLTNLKAYSLASAGYSGQTTGKTLTVYDASPNTYVAFIVDGNGKGVFNAVVDCSPLIQCGAATDGQFNGGPYRVRKFKVAMDHDGDMSFYITGMSVMSIKAYNVNNLNRVIARTPIAGINSLTIFNLRAGSQILFTVEGAGNEGARFDVLTYCESASPTTQPTPSPTITSTAMDCNTPISGTFMGEPQMFNVRIPANGDLTFFIAGVTPDVIKAYNGAAASTVIAQTPMKGINSLSLSDIPANTNIIFEVLGTGQMNQMFDAITQCIISAPGSGSGTPPAAKLVEVNKDEINSFDLKGSHHSNENIQKSNHTKYVFIGYLAILFVVCNIMICCCYFRKKYKSNINYDADNDDESSS